MTWLDEVVLRYRPREGQAHLYGVVLYTDGHPHIKKVIEDDDYWRALDERSGPRWVVFSVRAGKGSFGYPRMPPGVMGMLIPIWKEPGANRQLLEQLELESTQSFPALAVFVQDDEGKVLSTLVSLEDSSITSAYQSLAAALETVAKALDAIFDENRRKGAQAYFAVTYALGDLKVRRAIKGLLGVYRALIALKP